MRIIDADELIKMLQDTIDFNRKHNTFFKSFSMQHMLYILENMKTVDTVKHGQWEKQVEYFGHSFKCSVCQECTILTQNKPPNYCSNCGAKMDGGKHETD